jgi:hypothetical protein
MKTTKTTILYHIQASLDGGPWYDIDSKGFRSKRVAEINFDGILRDAYPEWRGLRLTWRIVKRETVITTDTEITVFATPSRGTKRPLIAEMFVPTWLPEKVKERLKMRRIPGAPEGYQPQSQLPESR